MEETDNVTNSSKNGNRNACLRSLVGLVALLLVGAVGLSKIPDRDTGAQANQLRTTSALESVERAAVSFAGAVSRRNALSDALAASYAAMSSECQGDPDFEIPPVIKPSSICTPKAEIATGALFSIVSSITTDAMGDKEVLKAALVALGLPFGVNALGAGILFVIAESMLGLVCAGDGGTSNELRIADVKRIAKYKVNQAFYTDYAKKFETKGMTLKKYKVFPPTMEQMQQLAQDYFEIAFGAVVAGVVAADLSTNAAITSEMLLLSIKEAAEKKQDKRCCQLTAYTIETQRQAYEESYADLRKAFNDYKALSMDETEWKVEKRNQWFCWNVLKGGWTNQYKAWALADDGSILADGWTPGGVGLGCYSNEHQKNRAKNVLRPKVERFFDDLEKTIFHANLTAFYKNATEPVEWKCNGEAYDPPSYSLPSATFDVK